MSAAENNVVALPKRYKYTNALIEPRTYEARVLDFETKVYWRSSGRVVVWWLIVEHGSAFETMLPSYFAVPGLIGPERRHGRFKPVGFKSKLARSLAAMLCTRPPLDHFPLKLVMPHVYSVEVVTVDRDHEQRELPEGAHYSKVDRVLVRVQ